MFEDGTLHILRSNPLTAAAVRVAGPWLTRSVRGFVFVASTGRSGTQTLQRLFDALPGCVALHEPYPIMNGAVLRAFNDGDDAAARRVFRRSKLPLIYLAARGRRWYAETNHLFVKSFAAAAVDALGPRMQVVHLTREPEAVAASCLHRGYVPGTPEGDDWWIAPRASRNHIRLNDELAASGRFPHPYFRCLWYCYELEARTREFAANYPQVPIHRMHTEQLGHVAEVRRLFDALGMPFTAAVAARVGTRANASLQRPRLPAEVQRSEVDAFHAICRERLEAQLAPRTR